MTIRAFTGYLNSALFGSTTPFVNGTFDVTTTPSLEIYVSDGAGDEFIEGDSNGSSGSTEQSEDAEGDQFLYVRDDSGNVIIDGNEFYLELVFEFQVAGQSFTGYHFEDENGLDFTILPPNVPAGTATVTSRNFVPNPDEVDYGSLSSGDEVIDDSFFSQLDFSGPDEILAGDGDDNVNAGAGDDTIVGGSGSDTISGGDGDDFITGDNIFGINSDLDSGQSDETFSFGALEGWFNDGSGGLIERWGSGFLGTNSDDGGSFLELDVNSSGGLDHLQTNVELDTGVEYVIAIDHAARPGDGLNDDFEITQNGVVIATVSPSSVGFFETTTVTVVGLAGTDTIGFREIAGQSNGLGVLLDNFTVSLAEDPSNPIAFNDTIDGGSGDDLIDAQQGDDNITGGIGDDVITTGSGDDTVNVTDGGGSDIVTDFVIGEDLLDVSALTDSDGGAITARDVTVTSDGQNGSLLTFDNGEQVTLRGVAVSDLDTVAELNAIGIPCFAGGTLIETENGAVSIEKLTPGTRVRVGAQGEGWAELRLNLNREVRFDELASNSKLVPVCIKAGALGDGLPERDLWVSRQHRMLVTSAVAMRMFDTPDVLVSAIRLTAMPGIDLDPQVTSLTYHHLVFDDHEIVTAEGAPSESFLTAPEGIRALSKEARTELFTLFPELRQDDFAQAPARYIPSKKRQNKLVSRHLKNGKALLAPSKQLAAAA